MKRYFTFETLPENFSPRGMYHYVQLPGVGYVCVFDEESAAVPSDWTPLPHLLASSTAAGFNGVTCTLGAAVPPALSAAQPLAGVAATDNTFQVAMKVATLHPLFHP